MWPAKKISIFILFLFMFSAVAKSEKEFVLVIDPGHGGRDSGAVGAKAKEKNINLDVALLFGDLVKENHPDVKIIFTRKTDKFVDLRERSNIANKEKADLFISIHTNATHSKSPYGAETYTLGLARNDDNLEVAKRENSVILLEDDYQTKYEGFDPQSSESYIIFEFIQNKFVEQSVRFASYIQDEFKNTSSRSDRGVRQAGFLVLRETSMPSVLVELGFISNKNEEAYLTSSAGQKSLATSLLNAFNLYKREHDRKSGMITKTDKSELPPVQVEEEVAEIKPVEEVKQPVFIEMRDEEKLPEEEKTTSEQGLIYKVQILASTQQISLNSPLLKGYKNVDFYKDIDGMYKYTYGSSRNFEEIKQVRRQIVKDFKDAFIIRFQDGQRVR